MAKTLTGVVTSDAADKTITVTVTSRETHPIYKKQYTVTRKYAAGLHGLRAWCSRPKRLRSGD